MRIGKRWIASLLAVMLVIQSLSMIDILPLQVQKVYADTVMSPTKTSRAKTTPSTKNTNVNKSFSVFGNQLIAYDTTTPAAISIPANVNVTPTDTTLTVIWDAVAEAESYEVSLDNNTGIPVTETNYTYDNLEPNTLYLVKVRAVNQSDNSEWSTEIIKYTMLPTPSNFIATPSSISVDLKWDAVTGASYYEIYRDNSIINTSVTNSYNDTGLTSGAYYRYKVKAITTDNSSAFSNSLSVTTTAATNPAAISIPTNVDVTTTDTTMTVTWDAVAEAQSYEVSLDNIITNVITPTYTYSNLQPNTQYRAKVRTVNPYGIYGLIGDINGDDVVDSIDYAELKIYVLEPESSPSEQEIWVGDLNGDASIDSIDLSLMKFYQMRSITNFPKSVSSWSTEISKYTLLNKPSNVISVATETQISLSWNIVSDAQSYELEINGSTIDNGTKTSYLIDGLEAGILHNVRIRGKGIVTDGAWTELLQLWTLPNTPQNIHTTTPSSISITLSWDEAVGASGYEVEVYGTSVDNGNSTTYTHTGLEPNTQRIYRVRAKNPSGVSDWSNVIAATTLPGTVFNLKVQATDNLLKVIFDAQAGALAYDIEIDGTDIVELTETKYIHEGLDSNSEHTYRVRSKNWVELKHSDDGESDWSETVKGVVLSSVPGNFSVTNVSCSAITLSWDQVTGASGYEIEIDGKVFNNSMDTSYVHSELNSNEEHTYRIRALNGTTAGEWTQKITKTTLLLAPTNLKATAASNQITLQWDMVVGAESYQVETDGEIFEVGANTEYIQTGLIPGLTHTFRVRAINGNGYGDWSTEVLKAALLGIPQDITASSQSTSIIINWSAVEGASAYDVMADGTIINNISSTSYEHIDLSPNSMHVYMVRTVNSDYMGEWSNPKSFFTIVGIPANISTTPSSIEITLTWDEVDGANSYDIMVDDEIINNGSETVYVHSGLSYNSQHSYSVRAKNENGTGEWSETVTQMTGPSVPANIKADAQINQITLTWDKSEGAVSYDVEVDGEIIKDILTESFISQGLEPNTRHEYRVRALNNEGICSEWSELLEVNTTEELIINVDKDTGFNFVIAVPKKEGIDSYEIVVNYNPEDVDVIDLYAATQKLDLEMGIIEGTNISIKEFSEGKIVFGVDAIDKSVITIVRFMSKTNEDTNMSYTIE